MSASYRKIKRQLDEAERLLADMRVNVLGLSLELHRLEVLGATVRNQPLIVARRTLGLRPVCHTTAWPMSASMSPTQLDLIRN